MKRIMERNNIYLILLDLQRMKEFRKYFRTEYEKDKFKKKLKYSKKIKVLEDSKEDFYK